MSKTKKAKKPKGKLKVYLITPSAGSNAPFMSLIASGRNKSEALAVAEEDTRVLRVDMTAKRVKLRSKEGFGLVLHTNPKMPS